MDLGTEREKRGQGGDERVGIAGFEDAVDLERAQVMRPEHDLLARIAVDLGDRGATRRRR